MHPHAVLPTQEPAGDHPKNWRATKPRTGGPPDAPSQSHPFVFFFFFFFRVARVVDYVDTLGAFMMVWTQTRPAIEFVFGEESLSPILVFRGHPPVLLLTDCVSESVDAHVAVF